MSFNSGFSHQSATGNSSERHLVSAALRLVPGCLIAAVILLSCQNTVINIPCGGSGCSGGSHSVTYNGNGNTGGSVPVDSNTYTNGQTVTVLGNPGDLTKTNYSFNGWDAASDGSGVSYTQGATFAMGSTNETLYAQWTQKPTYTVTYNGNGSTGGSVPVDSTNYTNGQMVNVLGNTGNLEKTGYALSGWSTATNGGGTSYAPGGSFAMGGADVTLYAQWITPGTKWESATLPANATWRSVTYGNGIFVAVDWGGVGAYSRDGKNWTSGSMPTSLWSSVTYGNGTFVAIGSWGAAYSTDGINWTSVNLPASQYWSSVAYGNGVFVAVAWEAGNGSETTQAAYSADGKTWTSTTVPDGDWSSVTYGNGTFVAVGEYGRDTAAYSTDGINWTGATLPASTNPWTVTYGNGTFVAVNGNEYASYTAQAAAYSTDGINWTSATLPASANWSSVTYGNGTFVAVDNGTQAAYSTDGIHWTSVTLPASADWDCVTYGNGTFVAVGNGTQAVYSP